MPISTDIDADILRLARFGFLIARERRQSAAEASKMFLMTVKEVAALTRTSEALWRKLIFLKRIKVTRVGRCVRIEQGELNRVLQLGTTPAQDASSERPRLKDSDD